MSLECGMWSVELRVATLRICNSACCLDKVVFLVLVDISTTFKDVWEPVPYGNVSFSLKLRFNR